MSAPDSVLLIAFGGPEKPADVRPFLQLVTAGRSVPPERIEEVAHHYEAMGGRSPLNELTFEQAKGLRRLLKRDGVAAPVYVGMRNWHPFLHETLAAMKDLGHRRALGIILSPFQTEASWERYMADVAAAREKVGPVAPEVAYAPAWFDHPRFIEAVADRGRDALAAIPPETRPSAPLIFTAHSVPAAMAGGSPYVAQFTASARAVAEKLSHPRWSVAYQSRSGSPHEPWLEPDIADVLRNLAQASVSDVVVAPIGFVCDHVEVLYDLDVEARQLAEKLGMRFYRAAAVNDHPAFVEMLAALARSGLGK
ncbi:MAG: ferrochelatase [Candidatus Rokubacteria bacterium]|nr:ferrochelatase [Candidatus Rokubacteria bacterium]